MNNVLTKNILYLSEDYPFSKVHHELCRHICLNNTRIEMTLFSLIRSKISDRDLRPTYKGINYTDISVKLTKNELRYKYDFKFKIEEKYKALLSYLSSDITLVHAATLFSEGAIAYKLYKEKGIPYVVAVRGTDINFYFRYMFHLWKLGKEILRCASKVVFITEQCCNSLLAHEIVKDIRCEIEKKKCIIPNGIEQFWIENIYSKKEIVPHRLLYIGVFDKNKNVVSLMEAVRELHISHPDISLTLIGGGGCRHKQVLRICQQYPDIFDYVGKIYDKKTLCAKIRECDIFAMPSHSETFGLVYVECLTQGLPVLYTKGQGIDGVFNDKVGVSVDSHSVKSISDGLHRLIENYQVFSTLSYPQANQFSWSYVANEYLKLYSDI